MSVASVTQKSSYTYRIEDESPFLEARGSTISLPSDSEDFSVSTNNGKIEVKVMINPDSPKVDCKFYLRATGFMLDGNEGDYIGTISLCNEYFVGHLFRAHPFISSPISTKKTIYKYPIPAEGESNVHLPDGAQKICTFVRRNKPFVYAIVDPNHHSVVKLSPY